jgi:hypothetical protein
MSLIDDKRQRLLDIIDHFDTHQSWPETDCR